MCGIAGVYDKDGSVGPLDRLVQGMLKQLVHRGPDDQGVAVDQNVALGHRRLSIIDLSEKGRQPLMNEDGSIWLVCNGEIYNFADLREDLEKRGHVFYGNSDNETIIHAYEEYGVGCLEYLHGMFAFALWDGREKRLFIARDRLGKKPLYYYHEPRKFLFASEIKAILTDKTVLRQVDPVSLDHYLSFQYVPNPGTMFQDIKKLPPGSFILLDKDKFTIQRYWQYSYCSSHERITDKHEAIDILDTLLQDATTQRMVSDVPLGAFLSGGIDSSLVVALMAHASSRPIKTFSIGFEEEEFSELPKARLVAESFGTEHQELIVKPDILSVLPKLIWYYGEPFGDSSSIPSYYLAEMTAKHVTVALSGDGGDELFGGYPRYAHTRNLFRNFPSFPQVVRQFLPASYENVSDMSMFSKIVQAINIRTMPPLERYYNWINVFSNNLKSLIYSDTMSDLLSDSKFRRYYFNELRHLKYDEDVDGAMIFDINHYLPDDLLVKVDIASMAHALEVRCPILDHRIAEFSSKLSCDLKVSKENELKIILREVAARHLPEEILKQKKKGFSIPLNRWLRSELSELVTKILLRSDSEARLYFNTESISAIIKRHQNGVDFGPQLWLLLNFFLWHMLYLEGIDLDGIFEEVTAGT